MWRAVVGLTLLAACSDTGCPESISSYCAAHGGCTQDPPLTWQAAQDPANWGSPAPPCAQTCGTLVLSTCNGVKTAVVHYVDTGTEYSYDASGMLDRITNYGTGGRHCEAGDVADPGFPDPAGCTSQMIGLCCMP